jgi:hypothetical protein
MMRMSGKKLLKTKISEIVFITLPLNTLRCAGGTSEASKGKRRWKNIKFPEFKMKTSTIFRA